MSDPEEIEAGVKGKQGELRIIGKLLEYGFNVFTPMVDMGLDCLIDVGDGAYREIQIKTRLNNPLFQVKDAKPRENFYIICYLLSKPEIWVIPSRVFYEKATQVKGRNGRNMYRLSIGREGSPSYEELRRYRDNFAQLRGPPAPSGGEPRRRVEGDHFSQSDMEVEILRVLEGAPSPMSTAEIVGELGRNLVHRFSSADQATTSGGRIRWEATARFAVYQGLKKKGFIEAKTKNQWVITQEGKRHLSSLQ